MSAGEYIHQLHARFQADGCDPRWEATPTPLLSGRGSDFKIQWMATKPHLVTIAATIQEITTQALEQFADFMITTATERKKRFARGIQTGIALFPALISERVDPQRSSAPPDGGR